MAGITLLRKGRVRRAKLYYLRSRRGKSARIVEKIEIKNKDINLKKQNLKSEEKTKVTDKKTKLENKNETLAKKPKDEKKDK